MLRNPISGALSNALRPPFGASGTDLRAQVIAALYGNGELGTLLHFRDRSTLFQDVAGTTPVTASGQPIARANDLSGNGANWAQADSAKQFLARDAGAEQDLIDDFMATSGFNLVPASGSKTWTIFFGYPTPGTHDFIFLMQNGSVAPWSIIGQSGSTSTVITSRSITQDSIRFDGAALTEATRGEQYTEITTSNYVVQQLTVPVDIFQWDEPLIGVRSDGNWKSPQIMSVVGIVEGALSSEKLALLEQWLAVES